MISLLIFAFIGGVVTILSPCILPILPIILSSAGGGKKKPLGTVIGFVLSFTFFTLFLTSIVRATGISGNALRLSSIVIIALFGFSLLIPKFQTFLEILFAKFSRFAPRTEKGGFLGGLIVGFSLGLLWTPCVGPILASVISLAITGTVSGRAFFITLAYSLGTAIPMFIIMWAGSQALQKVPWLVRNTGNIQKAFGVLMILTAIAIFFNFDRSFQTYILDKFPNYGSNLTKLEDNELVREALEGEMDENQKGRPMFELQRGSDSISAPEIITGGDWLNLPENISSLTIKELRGKVVLVDFWTYSCINCQRTFPYLRSWWGKYEDDGLVIIGVHAPEFEFEKDLNNLTEAVEDFELTYPIVQDNNFATWRAYKNRFWPAKYLIDKDGYIRYTHFGEGKYDETEEVIQALLAETGREVNEEINNPNYNLFSKTPETYLGHARLERFASPEDVVKDSSQKYSLPNTLLEDYFAFSGTWTIHEEYSLASSGSELYVHFNARNVFLVMNPEEGPQSVEIYLDNKLQEIIEVDKDALYQLIGLPTPGGHTLRLVFPDGGVKVYAFTFG